MMVGGLAVAFDILSDFFDYLPGLTAWSLAWSSRVTMKSENSVDIFGVLCVDLNLSERVLVVLPPFLIDTLVLADAIGLWEVEVVIVGVEIVRAEVEMVVAEVGMVPVEGPRDDSDLVTSCLGALELTVAVAVVVVMDLNMACHQGQAQAFELVYPSATSPYLSQCLV